MKLSSYFCFTFLLKMNAPLFLSVFVVLWALLQPRFSSQDLTSTVVLPNGNSQLAVTYQACGVSLTADDSMMVIGGYTTGASGQVLLMTSANITSWVPKTGKFFVFFASENH
jgi:hypothetical protein